MAAFEFPGEKYLLEDVPDYGIQRQMLIVKFFLTFVFWTMVLPSFLASEQRSDESPKETVASTTTTTKSSSRTTRKTTTTTIVKVHQRKTKKQSRTSKKNEPNGQNDDSSSTPTAGDTDSNKGGTVKVVDGHVNLLCLFAFLLHAIYLLVNSSPDNYYTSRTVFESPLFSQSECNYLVDMAERVAGRNYDLAQKFVETNSGEIEDPTMLGYLKEPLGWQKTRHQSHPTTDLNLVTDSFLDEDRAWIQQRLDARLAPTLERIFGVPPSAIRANDVSDWNWKMQLVID